MSAELRCPRKHCGVMRESRIDQIGRVTFECPACARNKRGRCRDCPAKLVASNAMRCPACARKRYLALSRERDRKRYPARRKAVLAHLRARRQNDAYRERRRRYMADYRARHSFRGDPLARAYQRVYMARRRANPTLRARENAQKRQLRRAKREQVAA